MDKISTLNYYPKNLQNIAEFKELSRVVDKEIEKLQEAINNALKDRFIRDLTIDGTLRWESILKITPKGTETLEDRRFRISARLFDELPYTMIVLKEKLALLCGKDGYKVNLENTKYKITIKVELSAKHQVEEIRKVLAKMIPTNMLQHVELIYNQYQTFYIYTHAELLAKTHNQLREEVI
ncbi:putative phage tail protein [Metaclostridioides mangenotii]|uniref:putative phage tail protein n=1 Tax=Metaclostridioides mangenotii TaxID=1540 RepID=UPI0026F030FC|nr:putative phage tail protein [Clostridioides mangenotii]